MARNVHGRNPQPSETMRGRSGRADLGGGAGPFCCPPSAGRPEPAKNPQKMCTLGDAAVPGATYPGPRGRATRRPPARAPAPPLIRPGRPATRAPGFPAARKRCAIGRMRGPARPRYGAANTGNGPTPPRAPPVSSLGPGPASLTDYARARPHRIGAGQEMARRVHRRTVWGRRGRVRTNHGARPPITQPGSCARGPASAQHHCWARPSAGSVGNRIRPSQQGGPFFGPRP